MDPDKPAVAVCFGGARSAYASQFLQGQGFEALNLDGGLQSWVRQGLPLVAEGGVPGRLVHDPPAPGAPSRTAAPASASLTDEEADAAHDSGELSAEMEELKNDFIEVVLAAQERFGDREPPEAEMRAFMKEWLVSKGKTPDEAEEILNR